MDIESLFNIWRLKSISDLSEGKAVKRNYKTEGRLIYSKPNHIFVGLCYHKPSGYKSNFYTGTFEVNEEESKVFHKIIISSDDQRNGSTLERSFSLEGPILTLRGQNHIGNEVELVWERESAK